MAESPGAVTSRAGDRRASIAVPLAVLLMLAAALTGFAVLLEAGPWLLTTLVAVVVTVGSGLLARSRARRWRALWSVIASSAGLVVVLVVGYASDTAVALVIPTLDTLERFASLIAAGELSIAEQALPAEADEGIRFLLALGVGALAIAADAIASLSRRPALAVVPALVVLAVPVVIDPGGLPLGTVVATGAAYLLLLAVHRPAASGGGAGAARAVAVGAAVLVIALALPPALPSVLAGDRLPGSGPAGLVTGINPVVELGDDLRRPNPVTVLTYSTGLEGGQYLTLSHLAVFEGQEVLPVPFDAPVEEATEVGPPVWFDDEVARTLVETDVTLRGVRSRWVPLPSAPTRIEGLTGRWVVDRDGVTVRTAEGSIRNGDYAVENWVAQPTPEQLRATTVEAPGLELYRAVPDDIDPAIEAAARAVVGSLTNPYEQALELQRYFTQGEFAYSEEAPVEGGYDGTGASIVAEFLQARSGYCVHFASAMTLMARTLGIPARMAVGFLPGTRNPVTPSEYTVSSDDLHTWPELHFDGIGWVRFEPTPSRGTTPAYAADTVPQQTDSPTASASPGQPVEPTATATPGAPSASPSGGSELPDEQIDAGGAGSGSGGLLGGSSIGGVDARLVLGAALLLLGALLVAPGVWRAMRRARRLRSPDALDRWRELRDTARDLGLPAESTRTPRDLAAAWAAGGAGGGRGRDRDRAPDRASDRAPDRASDRAPAHAPDRRALAVEELAALDDVRRALEARAYAAPGAPSAAPDIRPALRGLRARAPWWRRLLAVAAPASLIAREPDGSRLTPPPPRS